MSNWLELSSKGASIAALSVCANIAFAGTPTADEMWEIIQQQQETIESMGSTPATKSATHIGGYGELHINHLSNEKAGGSDKDSADLHRLVLFVSHEFSDSVRFVTEIEWEHSIAGDDKVGETEIEQAYIEFDLTPKHSGKAGVFLVPVGLMNETHEPNTFYGVERNSLEKNIIPSTWWEGGAALSGEIAPGFSADVAVHTGLFIDVTNGKYKIRDGRQKVGKAKADAYAYTGRVVYRGIPGLEVGGTLQLQSDLGQDTYTGTLPATLIELHANYQKGPLGLKAMYATWDIDQAIESASGSAGSAEQTGYLLEGSWKLAPQVGAFVRLSEWDNQAGSSNDSAYQQTDIGVNYWPHPQVAMKVDYQIQDAPAGKDEYKGFNFGIGWSF